MNRPVKEIQIFNPLLSTFSCDWYDDNNRLWTFKIEGMSIEKYPEPIANFVAKHLADHVLNQTKIATNYEDERSKVMKQIYI